MKRYFLLLTAIISLSFTFFLSPQQCFAANQPQECATPNSPCNPAQNTLNTFPQTCCPTNGITYACVGYSLIARTFEPGKCEPETPGQPNACADIGQTCQGNQHSCCPVSTTTGTNKGKPLTCNLSTNKCEVAPNNVNGCLAEGKTCGNQVNGTFYGDCCPQTNAQNQNLTCADSNNMAVNPVSQTGTCKFIKLTAVGPTEPPPPPSPPCQTWNGNGTCSTFNSAFGGFPTDPTAFIQKILAVLLSVSGGIALLLIIRAGYNLMTSQGNPEKLNNAREQLIAAIVGLVFLIFSFVFLELIGFDILHIPGFGGTGANGAAGTGALPVCQPGSCIPQAVCNGTIGHCNTNGCPAGQACQQVP